MTSRPPSGYQIRKVHPTLGNVQRYTLNKPLTFRCVSCRRTNTSSSVVTISGSWSRLLCGGCYGRQVAPRASPAQPPKPTRPAARPEKGRTASPLPRDMVWLAAMHRSVAEGKTLSPSEQELHRRRAGEASSIAAIRYAELLVDLEVRIADISGSAHDDLVGIRDELAARRAEAVDTFCAACHARSESPPAGPVGEPADVRIVRDVDPHTFELALVKALRSRGMGADALEPQASDPWTWLHRHDKVTFPELPADVQGLRNRSLADFVEEAVADVNRWECDELLAHPAVAEQWAACSKEIISELLRARQALEADLRADRGQGVVPRLRRAGEAYARASTRCLEAQLMVADQRAQATQLHRARQASKLRMDAAAEAAATVRWNDSALARQVDRAMDEHKAKCRRRGPGEGHDGCAPSIARVVRSRLQPVDRPVDGPPEVRESATDEAPPAQSAACRHDQSSFLCPDLLKQLSTDLARVVGVVGISYDDAGRFGFAWVTEYGELSTGVERAVNDHDAWLHAVCRAVMDLGGDVSNVQVVCQDERAASVVRYVTHHRLVPEALGFPVSDRTRDLLRALVSRPGKVFVSGHDCPGPHRGSKAARSLAVAALQAVREADGSRRVKTLADRISQELRELAELPAPWPSEDDPATQSIPGGGDAREVRWKTAVGRAQINGGWCVVPDGLTGPPAGSERLRLVASHAARESRSGQVQSDVLLRRVGDRWELHGIAWPPGLLPGTVVSFRWRRSDRVIEASTELMPTPKRVDELTYRHRYDLRVVVRENAPGSDQEGPVPDLSDSGWVMRALRKLGHLSPDGSVVLAETALVRNCLELGLPPSRVDRLHPAVKDLIRDRRLARVRGSLDASGLPSCPPRPGQRPADLLRYVPKVAALAALPAQRNDQRPPRRDHWVDGFVRRLPPGAHASEELIQAHREAVRAAEVVDRPLPDGFTYVRRHRRAR